MPLLQVDALISGFRRYPFELVAEPSDKVGEFALPVPHLPQMRDQIGALAIRLFQYSAKGKVETMGAITGYHLGKGGDRGQAFFGRDLSRRQPTDEFSHLGIGPPVPLRI
jgi:hypothetical protein